MSANKSSGLPLALWRLWPFAFFCPLHFALISRAGEDGLEDEARSEKGKE